MEDHVRPSTPVPSRRARAAVVARAAVLLALVVSGAALPGRAAEAAGTTVYVSNAPGSGCSDQVETPTATRPWCSPSRASGPKQPGDRILFGRGSSWDDQQVVLSGSGTPQAPIQVGAFGSGPRPHLSLRSMPREDYAAEAIIQIGNPSHWQVTGLELSHASAGVLAHYSPRFPGQVTGNRGLEFTDLLVHDVAGIREGVPNGNGSVKSGPCTGSPADPQDLDLWQSGGVAVTGPYTYEVPTSTWFVSGVTFRDIEGHNNLNVVNVDTCDAQLLDARQPDSDRPHLVRDVTVDNVWAYDGDGGGFATQCNEGMRFAGVTGLRVTNSRMQNLGACFVNGGTAGVILVSVTDAVFTNNAITDVPATESGDMTAIDNEIYVDRITLRNNLIARNAGPGIEFLSIRCRIGDYNTNHVVRGNSFYGNGGYSLFRGAEEGCPQAPFTGVFSGNLVADPTLVRSVRGDFSGWQFSDTTTLDPGDTPHHATDQFGSLSGASGWTYETTDDLADPARWAAARWVDGEHVSGVWSGGPGRGAVAPSEQTGGACAGCASSRTWTAPRDGTVVVRSRVLKSRPGGSGATARLQRDGATLDSVRVAGSDLDGVELDETLAVRRGDRLRFVVTHDVPSSTDWVSWAPSIAYVPEAVVSSTGDVAGGGLEAPALPSRTFAYAPAAGPWTFSPTRPGEAGAGIVGNGSDFGNPVAPEGAQAAFVQLRGSFSQRVTGLRLGQAYVVRLRAAQRPGFAPQTLQVRVDGSVVGSVTPTSTGYAAYEAGPFMATEAPHTITVAGTSAQDATAFVDDVHVVPVTGPALANPGFETPGLPGAGFEYDVPGAGWTFSGSGIFHNGSVWSREVVPQGSQAAFVQRTGTVTGDLAVGADGRYALALAAAQRPDHGGQTLELVVDGAVVWAFTPSSTQWRTHVSPPVALTRGTHRVQLRGTRSDADSTALVDDVRVLALGEAGARANPSFESPSTGGGLGYGTAGADPWRFEPLTGHGGSGITADGAPISGATRATEGRQMAFVQRGAALTSGPGWLEPGGTYLVAVDSAQRTLGGRVNAQQLRLEVDGVPVGTWTPTATWRGYAFLVTVPSSGRGQLSVVGTRVGRDETAFVDDVRVSRLT